MPSDVVKAILENHSTDTCRTGIRSGPADEKEVFEVKSLTSKPAAIYNTELSEEKTIGAETWRRYVKERSEYRATGRKLDCCEKCLSWDTRVERMIRATLVEIEQELVGLMSDYFEQRKLQNELPSSPRFKLLASKLQELSKYLDGHSKWDKRRSRPKEAWLGDTKPRWQGKLHDAEVYAHRWRAYEYGAGIRMVRLAFCLQR